MSIVRRNSSSDYNLGTDVAQLSSAVFGDTKKINSLGCTGVSWLLTDRQWTEMPGSILNLIWGFHSKYPTHSRQTMRFCLDCYIVHIRWQPSNRVCLRIKRVNDIPFTQKCLYCPLWGLPNLTRNCSVMYSQRQDVSYLLAEKKTKPPTSTVLYARIKDIELMEKLTARLYNKPESHNHVWELWHLKEDLPWWTCLWSRLIPNHGATPIALECCDTPFLPPIFFPYSPTVLSHLWSLFFPFYVSCPDITEYLILQKPGLPL